MKLFIDHTFSGVELDRFVAIYFDPAFNVAVDAELGVRERRLLHEEQRPDGQIFRRYRVVPGVTLPAQIRRYTRGLEVSYEEHSTYDPRRAVLDYCVDHAAREHLQVWGEIRFEAVPGGVRRIFDGEVKVKLFAVRSLVERVIERELRRAYDRKAAFKQRYLDAQRPAARAG